jgi:hypothetical protein
MPGPRDRAVRCFVNHRIGRAWLPTEAPFLCAPLRIQGYRPATNLHTRRCRATASSVTIRTMSFLGEPSAERLRAFVVRLLAHGHAAGGSSQAGGDFEEVTSGKERFSDGKIMQSCR